MTKRAKTVKIFYCYEPADRPFLLDLETQLKPWKRSGQIETWDEHKVPAGANRNQEIEKHLKEADIVLLFVSPDFFASDHCQMLQQQAMHLRETNKRVSVIPIIVRHALWEQDSIGMLQILPRNRCPINDWKDKDKAFKEIAEEIKEVVDFQFSQPKQASDTKNGFLYIGHYPVNGFRWDTDLRPAPLFTQPETLPDAPWLISQAVGLSELSQGYSIFDDPPVLRNFATLSSTTDAIKQFADSHGYLGQLVPLIYPHKVGQPDSILWVGEALQFWADEITAMNGYVTLWEMIRDRNTEALKECIHWKLDPKAVLFVKTSPNGEIERGTVIASENILPALFYQFEWGDVIKPALYFLCGEIDKRLAGHIKPTFFLAQQQIYMIPDSLLSALYVLLLLEIQEETSVIKVF